MKVFIMGGTGFLGTHLLPKLLEHSHDITVLTRSEKKAFIYESLGFESLGIKCVVGDVLQPESFIATLPPQDIVVSIAMPEFQPGRMSSKRFRALQNQTISYFSTPITVAHKLGCPLIVTLGTSFRTKGDELADESWPIERFGMQKIGALVDPVLAEVVERGTPPLIQMLPGQIYGPGGLFRNFMYKFMKQGKYRIIGSGANYIPRIHVEDCAEAYVQAIEKMPVGERFIIADDGQCTQREFSDLMADCMNVPRPKTIPGFIIRIVAGKLIYETATMNCRVSNAKAKNYLDWRLTYPTYREGLPAAIGAIENMSRSNEVAG